MEQLMGINGENIFLFLKANCSEIERMNERQKSEKPLALDANGSDEPLMLCRLEIPEQAPDFFSLPHHPPVGLHPSQGDKQKKTFPGRNRILSVHSSSAKPQRLSRSKAE